LAEPSPQTTSHIQANDHRFHPHANPQNAALPADWILTSLQLFVAVCELGSIGKAAEREFIAASAVSKRLSTWRPRWTRPLLHRHTRGVNLTPAGESLLHHARSVLFSLDKMQGELSEYADGVRGHVRMHANISAIVQFLPEDLGSVHGRAAWQGEDRPGRTPEHRQWRAPCRKARPTWASATPTQQWAARPWADCKPALPARPAWCWWCRAATPWTRQGAVPFESTLAFDHVGLHANSAIYLAMHQRRAAAGRRMRLRIAPSTTRSGTSTSSTPKKTARHPLHRPPPGPRSHQPQAFEGLRQAGRKVWRVSSIVATADHNTPTTGWELGYDGITDPISKEQVTTLDKPTSEFGAAAFFPFLSSARASCM
jgi:hypothetical protein